MVTIEQINNFLATKKLAMAGVSRDSKKFGNMVFKSLIEKGFEVCPINPLANEIDDVKCYSSVKEIPVGFDRLLIVTPENKTMQVVQDAFEKGIKLIWIQQKSENKEILQFAREKGFDVIYKKCIYMFAEPVSGGHKFHRTIAKIFGSYPKSEKKFSGQGSMKN